MRKLFENKKIEYLRKEKNLSQCQLAKFVGKSRANLSRREKGLVEPSIMESWKLSDFFEVSIDYLFGRKEN